MDVEKTGSTIFVIFGATGNLATKRIFPALFKLSLANLLSQKFSVIACARTAYTDDAFQKLIKGAVLPKDEKTWASFIQKIDYLSLDAAEDINLDKLSAKIKTREQTFGECAGRIFYMAISPDIFEKAILNLGKNNLHLACQIHNGKKPAIIVEKPFGQNLESARNLDSKLANFFGEDQIYRIDHYLGKETAQNIFAFRFANEIFEPVWNNQFIDHLQITTAEYIGVEKRGEFYDKTGALRDMVQNHVIQLLTLVTMEMPKKFTSEDINAQKLAVVKSIKIPNEKEIAKNTIRGQYEGYLSEEKINPASQTETYAMIKLFIENKRWAGVPFYLRTGKKLPGKVTSIIVQFKEKGHKFFENFWEKPLPNHITFQIQPNEGIGIRLAAKKPGLSTILEPVDMEFCYKTSFDTPQPEAYERLLLDVILGDQSLFMNQNVIEESWKVIDPIANVWQAGTPKLTIYKPGSWGPKEADDLIKRDSREWLAPLLTICKI